MFSIRRVMLMLLIVILIIPFSSVSAIGNRDWGILADHVEGVLLVQFENNFPEVGRQAVLDHANVKAIEQLNDKGLTLVSFNSNRPIHSVINQLQGKKGVLFVEPDYIQYPIENVGLSTYANPNDETYYNLLWGLHNTGQDIRGIYGVNDVDIDGPEAWNLTAGSSDVIVAVIDTAVDLNHPDLQGKIIDYQKFHRGREDKTHGTHVAGTIAANDNDFGVIGVAPDVKIMALAFLGINGGSTSDAIKAINYASANGAHIINASWGGGGYSQALYDAIAAFNGPFVAAAGNDGTDNDQTKHYPSSYTASNVVSVAAINNLGQLASFSNYGLYDVDIAAPGVDIASTYPDGYAWMSGTSMATPHVAGVLALMKSYSPLTTTQDLIQTLYASGVDLASLEGKMTTGKMINAYDALVALGSDPVNQPPQVTIDSPLDGEGFLEGDVINFQASIVDENLAGVTISWSSSLDGVLSNLTSFSGVLSLGDHTIQVTVVDEQGLLASDTVVISVNQVQANQPPLVTITSPSDGSTYIQGQIITFTASAEDPEEGDLAGQVIWSSDMDGVFDPANNNLSLGNHVITASVEDSQGLVGQDTIGLTIEADNQTATTSAGLAFSTEGGRYGDAHLFIVISLESNGSPVDGGQVSLDILLDGQYLTSFSGVTSGGQVTFKINKATSGLYTIDNLVIVSSPPWDGIVPEDSFSK